jgi:hypothetical protein
MMLVSPLAGATCIVALVDVTAPSSIKQDVTGEERKRCL